MQLGRYRSHSNVRGDDMIHIPHAMFGVHQS
jgi:hypothetical protein